MANKNSKASEVKTVKTVSAFKEVKIDKERKLQNAITRSKYINLHTTVIPVILNNLDEVQVEADFLKGPVFRIRAEFRESDTKMINFYNTLVDWYNENEPVKLNMPSSDLILEDCFIVGLFIQSRGFNKELVLHLAT
jgi:hypothetical protein